MSHLQNPLKERVEKIAKKYNVGVDDVISIESAIWEFIRNEISKGEGQDPEKYENILLKYLGTLHVQPRKMKKFAEIKND